MASYSSKFDSKYIQLFSESVGLLAILAGTMDFELKFENKNRRTIAEESLAEFYRAISRIFPQEIALEIEKRILDVFTQASKLIEDD